MSISRLAGVVLLVSSWLGLGGADLHAQQITGALLGIVSDPSSSAVSGVDVVVTKKDTGQATTVITNDFGFCEALYLRSGSYWVEVSAPGFKRVMRDEVIVQVESRVRLDVSLEVGDITTTLEVSGQSPLLQADSASLGTVVL